MSDEIRLIESRYERLEEIAWWDQRKLLNARVLVAGAGALGNEILKNLALLGIGRVIIVDFDTIELSNLSRSILFRAADRGRSKAETAAERLREINPDVQILPVQGDLRWDIGLGVYRRMDVVLAGLDSIGARMAINHRCWRAGVPWIDGGLDELSGMMRVYVPPNGACFECNLTDEDYRRVNLRYSCQLLERRGLIEASVPTTPTIAAVIGAWQVQEAVKFIHGRPVAASQGVGYQGLTHAFYIVNYRRRAGCPAHDMIGDVSMLAEASSQLSVDELLSVVRSHFGATAAVELDREIIYRILCPGCGAREDVLLPHHRLSREDRRCPRCGSERTLSMTHVLDGSEPFGDARLSELGIPPLHILTVSGPGRRRIPIELTGDLSAGPLADLLREEASHGNA